MRPTDLPSTFKLYALSILLTVIIPFAAGAQIEPVRRPEQLWEPKPEEFVRVSTSRVVIADYDLVRRDFKSTVSMSNQEIDQWLIAETSFISKAQAKQTLVNTKISTTDVNRTGYRPYEYRRGAVFLAKDGLLDAKGTGAIDPRPGGHDSGVATLGDMIREYLYEKLINHIFKFARSKFTTVGSYAVIDFGFDVIHADGSQSRAGYILRQAHTRYWPGSGRVHSLNRNLATQLPTKMAVEIEALLRRYGITSAGGNRKRFSFDTINIQGTQEGAVIDFGAFLSMDHFSRDVYIREPMGTDAEMVWSAKESPQPDPLFRVPMAQWGTSESGIIDPKMDNPFIWSHRLAESFARGEASRHDAYQHYLNLVEAADLSLAKAKMTEIAPLCRSAVAK
jgi:hypothetical protein